MGDELDPSVTYYAGTYEEDDNGDARLFLDAPGRRLAQVSIPKSQPPAVQYLHPDALGSSPLGTGQSGELASAVDQDPYGLRRFEKLNGDLPLPTRSYTGKELDPSSWYYYGGRYYDPSLARFTQVDPVSLNLTRPGLESLTGGYGLQAVLTEPHKLLNPYAYATNNPVTYRDPDGNFVPFVLAAVYIGWQAYDAYVTVKDVRTAFTDPNATSLDKGVALTFLALTFNPVDDVADIGKYGSKAVKAGERMLAKHALKDYALSPNWRKHILEGWQRADGTIVGEHVWNRAVYSQSKQGTVSMLDNGVRVHRWTENGRPFIKTYFPDHWTDIDIENAGQSLLSNGRVEGRRVFGEYKGVRIEGQLGESTKTLNSWYPEYSR